MNNEWEYLGDGVYAFYDGYSVQIQTGGTTDEPDNLIYLEPQVIEALNEFYQRKLEKFE